MYLKDKIHCGSRPILDVCLPLRNLYQYTKEIDFQLRLCCSTGILLHLTLYKQCCGYDCDKKYIMNIILPYFNMF